MTNQQHEYINNLRAIQNLAVARALHINGFFSTIDVFAPVHVETEHQVPVGSGQGNIIVRSAAGYQDDGSEDYVVMFIEVRLDGTSEILYERKVKTKTTIGGRT